MAHFVQISSTLVDSLSNCATADSKYSKYWPFVQTQAERCIHHSLIVDNVLLQTSTSRFLSSLIFLNVP